MGLPLSMAKATTWNPGISNWKTPLSVILSIQVPLASHENPPDTSTMCICMINHKERRTYCILQFCIQTKFVIRVTMVV